jgi:hypothetical protein
VTIISQNNNEFTLYRDGMKQSPKTSSLIQFATALIIQQSPVTASHSPALLHQHQQPCHQRHHGLIKTALIFNKNEPSMTRVSTIEIDDDLRTNHTKPSDHIH